MTIIQGQIRSRKMAVKRDTGAILKQVAWAVAAIALVFTAIHFAPIISHGG
jgi:hypothetical protein